MFGMRKARSGHRYYLLPSMGRSNRRHRRRVHLAAILFGVAVSALFGLLLYLTNRR